MSGGSGVSNISWSLVCSHSENIDKLVVHVNLPAAYHIVEFAASRHLYSLLSISAPKLCKGSVGLEARFLIDCTVHMIITCKPKQLYCRGARLSENTGNSLDDRSRRIRWELWIAGDSWPALDRGASDYVPTKSIKLTSFFAVYIKILATCKAQY